MKTSKIKEVVSAKPHHSGNIYHNLVMENGDKINIGKRKAQQVGWELTYEITDTQQEYNKAKSVQPQNDSGTYSGNELKNDPPTNDPKPQSKYEPKDQGIITWLSCFSSVCQNTQQSQMAGNMPTLLKLTNEAFAEAIKHSTLKPTNQ